MGKGDEDSLMLHTNDENHRLSSAFKCERIQGIINVLDQIYPVENVHDIINNNNKQHTETNLNMSSR